MQRYYNSFRDKEGRGFPGAVRPGEYLQTTVHFRVGTATASQEVTYVVGFDGYWV